MRMRLFVCVLLLLGACQSKRGMDSGNIIKADIMKDVMWDMFKADAFTERFLKTDSTKKAAVENAALQQKIFDLHKVSKEDYYTSYHYYAAHPVLMRPILDSISIKAEKERSSLMESRYSGSHAKE